MTVRPFDWRDLAALHYYRNQSVYLDSALVLTRGPLMVPGALFSYLAPGLGIFTAVNQGGNGEQNVFGQIIHLLGSPFAHLTFVTPDEAFDSAGMQELLEYLVAIAGERGAFRLLAEADDQVSTYETLRRSGFAVYSRQRIWQLTRPVGGNLVGKYSWRQATRQDALAIRLLYNNLVPGLVQQIEPFSANTRPTGMIYHENNDLLAFVEIRYGHRGIWAQPFFHPDAQEVSDRFIDLLQALTRRGSRPVYICVRSYQSWLEPAIEELGAEAGPRQAVMVKHLSNLQKAYRPIGAPALEKGQPEVTASMVHSDPKKPSA